MNWTEYFERAVPAELKSLITPELDIDVFNVDYITKLNSLLTATEPRVIANYAVWRLVNAYFEKQPKSFLDKWIDCITIVVKNIARPATALYVKAHYTTLLTS